MGSAERNEVNDVSGRVASPLILSGLTSPSGSTATRKEPVGSGTKVIKNLAHPDKPNLTRASADQNVNRFETRLAEALDQLGALDNAGANTR
jgi:hypothetical protein